MITQRAECGGLYWPDYDEHPERTYAAVKKRERHADAVLPYARGRDCVVQAGGHVGVWPLQLRGQFSCVYTFEPDEACFEALQANCSRDAFIYARCCALQHTHGAGYMIPGKCSSWRYTWEGEDDGVGPAVAAVTIDQLQLSACDAIILDVEGCELDALHGARETIARFHPVIQLEEWYDNRQEYLQFMSALRYRVVAAAGADTVYVYGR